MHPELIWGRNTNHAIQGCLVRDERTSFKPQRNDIAGVCCCHFREGIAVQERDGPKVFGKPALGSDARGGVGHSAEGQSFTANMCCIQDVFSSLAREGNEGFPRFGG